MTVLSIYRVKILQSQKHAIMLNTAVKPEVIFKNILRILIDIRYTVVYAELSYSALIFFPGPLAFCKKAVERVSSEKNILNSSVECVEWSGVEWSGVEWFFLEKVICMYIIRSASMS